MTPADALRLALVVCAVTLPCVAAPASAQSTGRTERDLGAADFDWTLLTLDGARTTLEAFRGRVLVINHWATWCAPCLEELPSLAALRAAVPDTGVVFLLVTPQARKPVAEFVRRRKLSLPVYLEATTAPRSFGLEAVPTTWLVAGDGRIVLKRRGAMRWDTPELFALLRALASERAPTR